MTISVIIPVFNAGEFLPTCIDSVLSQQMSDFELLLINDGSTDDSGALCDRYASRDTRIRVFHTPNQGVSTARNLGLDNARGEFVVFVDADDWITPDHLQQFVDSGIGEDGVAFTSMVEERPTRRYEYAIPDSDVSGGRVACMPVLIELMRRRCFGWTCNKMFSRATIEHHKLRFNKDIHYIEDEIFTAQYCVHITHVSCNSHPTYHYRFVPTSLLHRGPDPLMVLHARILLLQNYQALGYVDEVLYLASRILFSRMRKLIRREKWSSETSEKLTDSLLENWETLRKYSRSEYRKNFYDTKTLYVGWLTCGPGSRRWARLAIKGLRM